MKLSLKGRELSVFDGDTVVASAAAGMTTLSGVAVSATKGGGGGFNSSLGSGSVLANTHPNEPRKKPAPFDILSLDLSHNNLQVLVGARALRFLTELNVSHNKLMSLGSLPQTLERLTVHHNSLTKLDGVELLTSLRFLDISHNEVSEFASTGKGMLPQTLTTLIAANNSIVHTKGLSHCQSVLKLNLEHNRIGHLDELAALGGLRALRHLSINGNPVASNPRLLTVLTSSIHKLTTLDGMTLSQAQANRSYIAAANEARSRSRSASRSVYRDSLNMSSSAIRSRDSVARSRRLVDGLEEDELYEEDEQVIEMREDELRMRALEARVTELRRLNGESEQKELVLKQRNRQLQSQLKRTLAIIDEQDLTLSQLRNENETLGKQSNSLQKSVASLENAFRSQHASVVYTKLSSRGASTSKRAGSAAGSPLAGSSPRNLNSPGAVGSTSERGLRANSSSEAVTPSSVGGPAARSTTGVNRAASSNRRLFDAVGV